MLCQHFVQTFLLAAIFQVIIGTEAQCNSSQFECNNGNCIDLNNLCDFVDDCGDRSDEQRYVTGFKCPVGRKGHICVLPQRLVNDSIGHCADDADLCEVDGINRCHKCLTTGMVLASYQLCDGVVDCPDTSDECLCETTAARQLCNKLMPGQMMRCDNSTRISINKICDGKLDCAASLLDEKFCRYLPGKVIVRCPENPSKITKLAVPCDGNPECNDFSDECDGRCSEEPSFCSLLSNDSMTTCSADAETNFTFSSRDICDGLVANCSESFEDERKCLTRFYCASNEGFMISIDASLVCNGIADCFDRSDEVNCTMLEVCSGYPDCEEREYKPGRFSCEKASPISTPSSYIMDGQRDCQDGSDECPPFLDELSFWSRRQLSSRLEITIWLWIMAVVGVIANVSVFTYTLRKLTRRRRLSSIVRVNYILILNLNVADFLTSLYLLVIGSLNAKFSGIYCQVDLWWRTSSACDFMGSLAVFSAETSLLMLTLMTSQRLYTTLDPLKRNSIRLKWVVFGVVSVWCFSAVLAMVPSLLPNIFIERYWVKSKYFDLPLVQLPVFDRFFRNLIFISESANSTALSPTFNFRSFLAANYPQFRIYGDFGYYSENSFCVPHFYTPQFDNGWFYPTLTVTINLAAFIYVAIAYIIIYKVVCTRNSSDSNQHVDDMRILQSRIAKLVAVNFAVWLPICIASYIQLGTLEEFSDSLFVVTAVVLFPINSIMNPLLYSDVFQKAFRKAKSLYYKFSEHNRAEGGGTVHSYIEASV